MKRSRLSIGKKFLRWLPEPAGTMSRKVDDRNTIAKKAVSG